MISATGHAASDWPDTLQSHVQAITHSLQDMMALLVREREALVARSEASSLESIAQDKQSAASRVSALYDRLRTDMERYFGPGMSLGDGMNTLRGHSDSIAIQVDELVQMTNKCRQANRDNGVLVGVGLDNSQQALKTLAHVGASAMSANTYNRSATQQRVAAGTQFIIRA